MLFKLIYPDIYAGLMFQEILAKAAMQVCMTRAKKKELTKNRYNKFLSI